MSSLSESIRKLRGSFMKSKKKEFLEEVKAMQPTSTSAEAGSRARRRKGRAGARKGRAARVREEAGREREKAGQSGCEKRRGGRQGTTGYKNKSGPD